MANAVLSWTASPGPNLAGYKIHQGPMGGPYNDPASGFPINVGNVLTYEVTGLAYNTGYYLVVTAYNPSMVESAPSNEVGVNVPNPVPAPPSGLTVVSTS